MNGASAPGELSGLAEGEVRIGEGKAQDSFLGVALQNVLALVQFNDDAHLAEQFHIAIEATDIEFETLQKDGPRLVARADEAEHSAQAGSARDSQRARR